MPFVYKPYPKLESKERHSHSHAKNSLFSKIMVRLSFPLFAMGAVFVGFLLTNEIKTLNEFYRLESRFAFESIHKTLLIGIKHDQILEDPNRFKETLKSVVTTPRIVSIDVFDLLKRRPYFEGDKSEWTDFDYQNIDESLNLPDPITNYLIKVNKEKNQLIAYIPVGATMEVPTMIVRVVFSLADIKEALGRSRLTLTFIILLIAAAGIVIGQGLARSIVNPLQMLNRATQQIVRGNLGQHVEIHSSDEIEALAHTFNKMSDTLKEMKQRAEDANPLTQLPGNHGVFHVLKKRIYERQKFVVMHIDLDRFKIYNDKFGLAKGDVAIKKTADLLSRAISELGSPDDFLGHPGGDDFVIITRPNKAKELSEFICKIFDSEIVPQLYPKDDILNGYTLEVDRRRITESGQEVYVKFPLMAITIAGVSTIHHDFADYLDCMTAAAQVKKEAKKVSHSSYLIRE